MEDTNNFPCCYCHALEPRVAKDKELKTVYDLKYSIRIVLVTCIRVLKMKIEELPYE